MANYNKVLLMGNMTRDPQVRYTPSGAAVVDFGLAVNRRWRSTEGEDREEVCFVDITAFGRTGEVISEYKSKGDPIFIEGRLQMQSWQGQDGQKRTKHVVIVENFQFLNRRSDSGAPDAPSPQRRQAAQQSRPQPNAPDAPAPEPEPGPQDQGGADDPLGGDDIPF